MFTSKNKFWASALVISSALLISACGGGGSDGTAQVPGPVSGGGTGQAPGPASLALSGTAATGAPIANATVSLKCNSSTGAVLTSTATTNADGAYTATVTGASVPCLLQVQVKDNTGTVTDRLHSLASAAGVVNITPLTNAIVAGTLGEADPSATFSALDATKVATLTTAIAQNKHTDVWTKLKAKLTDQGVDTSAITGSPITQAFLADAANKGKGYDKVLDDIGRKGLLGEHLYRMSAGLPVPPTKATGLLNDTGIDWCTENISTPNTWVNNVVCSTFSWVNNLWGQQQDALLGRDAQAKANTLTKLGGGAAGFDYTKIGANGKPLTKQDGTYSDTGTEAAGTQWDCVRDNVTGLVWEVKRNDAKHLRHVGHTYTWYNPDTATNGGGAGLEASSTCEAGNTKCNTQSYVTAVNQVGLCGKKDWRLPTMDDLNSLVHSGRANPAMDTSYFPNTANDAYWSSSPNASGSDYAWFVNFVSGNGNSSNKNDADRVRLVRSGQ